MTRFAACLATVLLMGAVLASPVRAEGTTPIAAKTLLSDAESTAARQKKTVFVMFHATW